MILNNDKLNLTECLTFTLILELNNLNSGISQYENWLLSLVGILDGTGGNLFLYLKTGVTLSKLGRTIAFTKITLCYDKGRLN